MVPENFQPVLSSSQIKNNVTTIGGLILGIRGGGFLESAGTALLKKLLGSTQTPEDIWGGEPKQKKKNSIFILEIVTVSSYFAPAVVVIAILGYFFGNQETNVPARTSKRSQRQPGILQKGKNILDKIKTLLVGTTIEEEPNFETNL